MRLDSIASFEKVAVLQATEDDEPGRRDWQVTRAGMYGRYQNVGD